LAARRHPRIHRSSTRRRGYPSHQPPRKNRLYLPAAQTDLAKIADRRPPAAIAQGSTTKKNGVPGLRCLGKFGGGRNEGEAGKEVEEHGKKLGPSCSSCEGYKEGG